MKKVILFAAVATTIALASCGKKATEEAPAVDSMAVDTAVVTVDTAAVDTMAVDTMSAE